MLGSHGTFHWNELMTRNVERARKFYADTIGWSFDGMPMPGGGTLLGRHRWTASRSPAFSTSARRSSLRCPECWMSYLAVDDVDARVEKGCHGRRQTDETEPFDVPGVGRIAILLEPGGAGVGWITPAS